MMKIAIWGAGGFGKYIIKQLLPNDLVEIQCIIDNNAGSSQKVCGVDVVSPNIFLQKYGKDTDCVLVAFMEGLSISKQLEDMGIEKYGFISKRVFHYKMTLESDILQDCNILWNNDKELYMPRMETLETNVVDFCNMNCKGCSHFSNIFDKGDFVPYEVFERDIKQLSDKVFIQQFNLLGGEVFYSENLADYIKCLRKYMPKTAIELVTNGMLIPRQKEELLKVIQQERVTVSITEYPPVTKVKDKIMDKLDEYHIYYEFRPVVETFGKNIDLSGKNEPHVAQSKCRESTCQFLRAGKIYKCPFSALGNIFFKYYNIPLSFDEGADIYASDMNWKEYADNVRAAPIEQCRYCGTEERFSWEMSNNPQKEEWIIDYIKNN
ncbi:MAG: radical SAM protein [Lachnospiraceae bacterium]|nr:radical SAM protein [Lachnospiraceae bacterium]